MRKTPGRDCRIEDHRQIPTKYEFKPARNGGLPTPSAADRREQCHSTVRPRIGAANLLPMFVLLVLHRNAFQPIIEFRPLLIR